MGLLRRTLGRGYRLARRTAGVAVRATLRRAPPPGAAPGPTEEEHRFLHMLLSRNQGYARARGRVPSPTIAALQMKRLVAWERDGDGFAIALTPAGLELARRRTP